jgi:hypothetical protein
MTNMQCLKNLSTILMSSHIKSKELGSVAAALEARALLRDQLEFISSKSATMLKKI